MSSSTSSSKAIEWRVVAVLVLGLLVAEIAMRVLQPKLSRDVAELLRMPQTADELRAHTGHKVLLLGNSLTRCSIDKELLVDGLRAQGRVDPKVFTFVPDGTSMTNWDYGLRRYFLHTGAVPDELLLGIGRLHLGDVGGDASRLARFFVDDKDFSRAWREDLSSWEEKCEFLISRFSVLHSSRQRVKPHVFMRLIPHYFEVEQSINNQLATAQARSGDGVIAAQTYRHLTSLLDSCQVAHLQTRVISIPLPEPYDVADEAVRLIHNKGAKWLPVSNTPGLTQANFPDGYHLDPDGARVFTLRLLEAFAAN